MKVLLTGSTGFIGTHLISYLQSNHISITCLSREILSDNNAFNNFIKSNQFKNKNNYDVLIHLAAELDDISTKKLLSSNVSLTKKLLKLCKKLEINKFIFTSSQTVYGKTKYLPIDEEHPKRPFTNYGKSKLMAEKLCNKNQNGPLKISILRISSVFGSGQDKKFMIPKMFKDLSSKKLIVNKYRNGFQLIDLIHVDDVCNAILKSCKSKQSGTYNIASGRSITPFDIAKIISKFTDDCKIMIQDKNQYTNHSFYDITKAYAEIQFKAKIKPDSKILNSLFKKSKSVRNLNNYNVKL